MSDPLVSIVIPTKDKKDMLKQCLDSLEENTKEVNYEIVLVDNGSTEPGLPEMYQALNDKYSVVKSSPEFNFSRLCNEGAKEAVGKYLLFLNNDTILTAGWLTALLSTFHDMNFGERVGCVGGKLLFPDGRIQHIGQILRYHDKVPTHIYYGRDSKEVKVKELSEKRRRVIGVTAACMLTTKSAFDEVQGFDENFVNGIEDVDLCFKMKEKGYTHYYTPGCVVYHIEHGTLQQDIDRDTKNLQYFFQKWGNKLKRVEQP